MSTDKAITPTPDFPPSPGPGVVAKGREEPMGLKLYCRILDSLLTPDSPLRPSYYEQARRLREELAPRDAIEKLMVDHILWLHARLAHLSFYASVQKELKPMQAMHWACDRLADTVRRHLTAFADYREPGRRRFTAVKQANIARQQIVTGPLIGPEDSLRGGTTRQSLMGGSRHDGAFERFISETEKTAISALEEGVGRTAKKRSAE